eukprot:TRINITY_DN1606_c0_g2_i1.p1 TRINITY_DN1606_c0_g2~~TRINITY_DN1606_c0_g2_i1.p1  ORF type:complete len:304 (+),score=57.68 TRINITY_DN1606_c0_g2_i1:87-998(+)
MVAGGDEGSSNIVIPFEEIGEGDAEVQDLLKKSQDVLSKLQAFKGCGEYIREAITNPNPQTEEKAWDAVVPSVETLKGFYEFSLSVEKATTKLLKDLCQGNPAQNLVNPTSHPTSKQMAQVFDFVVRFDDAKMTNPAIQNDFSYYRRMLNRMKLSNKKDKGIIVNDEMANSMSLFFAYPTPMMNTLIRTAQNLGNEGVTVDAICKFLAAFTNSCYTMVKQQKFTSTQTNMLALRTVTGAIILFDHINPKGVFHKKTPIHVKNAINIIKAFKDESTESLVSAIKFNTVHLGDPDTQPAIKTLLG